MRIVFKILPLEKIKGKQRFLGSKLELKLQAV
jgi:hypothetical protein